MNPLDQAVEAVVRALGLTDAAIARRKAFLEFTDADAARLKALHEALKDLAPDFVNAFYSHLLSFEETRRFISDAQSLERLKRTQAAYFDSLTAGDYGPDYICNRLRVGIAHQRIGLVPQWYLGAYSKYLSGLLPEIWQRLERDPAAFVATCQALNKIVLLDMGLAFDTYIHADRQTILALCEYAEMVLASIPDGLLALSSGLAILSANRTFLERFGLTAKAVRSRPLSEVVAAEGLEVRALEVLESGIAQHDVLLSMGAMGSEVRKPVRVTLTGIRLAEEEEARLLMIVEDLSEEERLRTQARLHETRFHEVVEHATDGIVMMGKDGLITYFNRAAEQMFGYRRDEVLGRSVILLMPEIYRGAYEKGLARFLTTDESRVLGRVLALEGLRKDGAIFPIEMTVSVYRTDGEIVFTGVLRDITERRQAETALQTKTDQLQAITDAMTAYLRSSKRVPSCYAER